MVVYEAVEKHYKKILRFLAKQPKESVGFRCFQIAYPGMTITEIKEKFPVYIFVVEDQKGTIKGVLFAEARLEAKLATWAFAYIDYEDWVSENRAYFNELLDYALRYAYNILGLEKGDFFSNVKFALWLADLCGIHYTLIEASEHAGLGKIHHFQIDIKGYAT